MSNTIFENLVLYFPNIADQMVKSRGDGNGGLIVNLRNGDTIFYDDINKSIRNLPRNSNSMTEEECRKEFGIRLRKLMFRKGVTQAELSDMTGIQQSALSNYITGKTSPSFYNVDKIAKALECSVDIFRYQE